MFDNNARKILKMNITIYPRLVILSALISLFPWKTVFAGDFYCGSYLVQTGDTTYDVAMKCEKPGWTDKDQYELIQESMPGMWEKKIVDRETWLYNYGPNRFMKELIFTNDKLTEINDLGYGCATSDIGKYRNMDNKLQTHMSKLEVLIYWGEPDYKTSTTEERLYQQQGPERRFIKYNVSVAKWIYNAGANRFIKTLTFENNQLINIESGKYGYDR